MSPKENKFLKVILTCFEYSQSTYSHADCEYVIFKKLTFSHFIEHNVFAANSVRANEARSEICSEMIKKP